MANCRAGDWISTGDIYLTYLPDGSCVPAGLAASNYLEIELEAPEDAKPIFSLFRSLPIELRLKIWCMLLPEPGVLYLEQPLSRYPHANERAPEYSIWRMGDFRNEKFDQIVKTMSLTCNESRSCFEKHYRPIMLLEPSIAELWEEEVGLVNSKLFATDSNIRSAYIDEKRDTFYFRAYELQPFATSSAWIDIFKLRHLAIEYSPSTGPLGSAVEVLKFLEHCPSLKTLQIVLLSPPEDPWYQDWNNHCFVEVDSTIDSIIARNPYDSDQPELDLSKAESLNQLRGCRHISMGV